MAKKAKKAAKKAAPKAAPKKAAKKAAPKKAVKKAATKTTTKKTVATKTATTKTTPATKVVAAPKKNIPVPPKKPVLVTPKNTTSKQFNQSELFESIRGCCGFNKRSEAKEFYGSFVGMIQGALKSGYKVVLPGLGKIQVKKTKARMGRNPATQQPMMIPAKRKVSFTVLRALKDSVL